MLEFITKVRNYLFDRGIFKSSEFDLPIIGVGNLAVGGSGKTPHIEYLIRLLKEEFKTATLSRGYGRKSRGFLEVEQDSPASQTGDEPLQIKQHFTDIKVFVNENRVEGVSRLLFNYPEIKVILLDDVFQHRAIKPGMNILLTDYEKIFTRDKVMPMGRLREHPKGAKRADIIVVTKCPFDLPEEEKKALQNEIAQFSDAGVFFSGIKYSPVLEKVFDYGENSDWQNARNIVLVSGIAKSRPLEEYIRTKMKPENFEHFNFRDHYRYKAGDLKTIEEKFNTFADPKIIICTDKDAVRLAEAARGTSFEKLPLYRQSISVEFLGNDKERFNKKILDYVRQNKTDHEIYQD